MSPEEKRLYVGLAIFGTFAGGGVFVVTEHPIWGSVLLVGGAVGFIYGLWEGVRMPNRSLLWTVVLILTWSAIGYDWYDRHFGGPQMRKPEVAAVGTNSWGSLRNPTNKRTTSVFLDLNTLAVGPKAKDYRFVLVARVPDDRVDGLTDKIIEKSSAFSIVASTRRIEAPLGPASLARIHGSTLIDLRLVILPVTYEPEQIVSLSSLEQLKAITEIHVSTPVCVCD